MALALTYPQTAPTGHRTTRHNLTDQQRHILDKALNLLGTVRGLVEDQPLIVDAENRQYVSNAAAFALGITITKGHEIAQCHDCPTVLDGRYAVEDEGRIRCEECREIWAHSVDPDYGLPDTTWDA